MTPWTWTPDEGPPRLRADLASQGFTVVRLGDLAREAPVAPWTFVERLFREAPRMVERQPIRPVAGGRSFASTDVFTPLHTDSQLHLGAPPGPQIMVCERAASAGGESHLIDAWALCESIERADPRLFEALLRAPRRIPFVFGDVFGPTLAIRGDALTFTHSPMAPGADPVATALAPWIERAPKVTLRIETGDTLVVDNHRMLHGRAAFRDGARSFVRVLAWLSSPLGDHPRLRALASQELSPRRVDHSASALRVRARFGVEEVAQGEAARRLKVVFEMLRGVPPGVLAGREGVAEAELYAWRDAAIAAAAGALVDVDAARDESALKAALDASKQRAARRR